MRGGSLRYQAQNLRQLHLPALATINDALLNELAHAASSDDQTCLDEVVDRAFRRATPGRR